MAEPRRKSRRERFIRKPVVGVGAVVIHEGKALLVKRSKDPLAGRWVIPGGAVEWGETLIDAVKREVLEETGVRVLPKELILVFDRIDRAGGGREFHYVILDYLCDYVSGSVIAGSDALEAVWASPEELTRYDVPKTARSLILQAFERLRGAPGSSILLK